MPKSTNRRLPAPHRSASELRHDWVTGQQYVLASDRQNRPNEFLRSSDPPFGDACSFCAGREHETTPTEVTYPPPPTATHGCDWQVRVVENLYPIFSPTTMDGRAENDTNVRVARGQHFVIIESPTHRRQLTELSVAEVQTVFFAYRDQLRRLQLENGIEAVLLFKNSGRDAGMSREHVHSQVVAWPNVPPVLELELTGSRRFFADRGECVFCRLLNHSLSESNRGVHVGDQVATFCPYASRVPFETWVMPRQHAAAFQDAPDSLVEELAMVIQGTLLALERCLGPVAYNYLLHTLPFNSSDKNQYHWHFEILPRTSRLAGLEWGSGLLVNTVDPEEAAGRLRRGSLPTS